MQQIVNSNAPEANLRNPAGEISWFSVFKALLFPSSDVCIGLRLQQVMKSQWQTKSLERSKPLKKLSLKHKLSSSKEKHKFTNSLMAVSKYRCVGVTEKRALDVESRSCNSPETMS